LFLVMESNITRCTAFTADVFGGKSITICGLLFLEL